MIGNIDLLELPSMASLPCGDALPSPWVDPERQMLEAVFGCTETEDALETDTAIASDSVTPLDTPYYSSGNPYLQGTGWPVHAFRSSEGSETSSMLVETGWAPSNNSGSCAQSSDSEGAAGPAPAVGATRTLRRSRARHHQHSEAAAPAQPADQEQAMQQQALYQQTASQVQSLDPAPKAQPRPEWACHKGNTILGVVRPFECVKGYGSTGARGLQEINAALKKWRTS